MTIFIVKPSFLHLFQSFPCHSPNTNISPVAAGLGRHVLANKPWQAKLGTRINYPANITYTITWPLIKISILFLYRRIFFVVHRFKQYINVFIAVLFSYLFSTLFVDIFICWPVSKVWNPSLEGKCLDYLKLFYATASLNVFFDVLILASPMPLVWRLNATLKLKLGLSFIFILGGLTCVCSAMRLATFKHINEWDNTWTYIQSDYWIVAELCLSVICACVPTMRPLWLNVVSLYRRSRSRGSDNLSDKPPTGQNTAKSYPFRREISNPAAVHSPTSPSHSRTFSPTRHGFARLSDDYIGYQHGRGGVVQEDTIWEERLANKDGKEVRVHVDV